MLTDLGSHPNDGDAHFRMSEEQMFTSIFAYVDHLFGKIKPKKLFFMAVDGVAPRAKMNQQRSRRFRTAKEARELREKAERKGEKLPEEKAFDSNCITPGTMFMVKLSEQLRYFVNKKITEDANWRDVQVVLSGHEVPGEGEHKIMEYIRLSKAQPDYSPNVRHCLYGLDADLIMLGLLSHDPHFCLLREEVKLESINFYLLHLSLLREYLDLEFRDVCRLLPFDYNLERIIDDFIVLAVFVGNDFLPHLPDLHIHENGLEKLFDVYMKVLPSLGGYLNDSGVISMPRLQAILDEMAEWEKDVFAKEYADLSWYKGKQARHVKEMAKAAAKAQLVLTQPQREIFDKIQAFVLGHRDQLSAAKLGDVKLAMPNTFPARERQFITNLATDLHLDLSWDEYDEYDQNLVTLRFPVTLEGPISIDEEDNGEDGWEDDDEAQKAVDRVLKKYGKAKVMKDDEDGDFDARHDRMMIEKMDEWKREYYKGKLEISYDDPEQMHRLIYRWAEGLQWVIYYYYSGVASWSWFYDYHYAPRISDLKGIDRMTFSFELGTAFKPFEQLMGVLPEASKDLIPQAYQELMYDSNSPILAFYPQEFEQDLNGKKQDWEAIVKIPFIDEKRLLKAMHDREHRLTKSERERNTFGTSYSFRFNPGEPTVYPSSLPGFFPALHRCTCTMEPFDLPTLEGLHLVKGLLDGVLLGAHALAGFPSLKTLPHTATLGFHGVNVHGTESRNKSIVVHIENRFEGRKTTDIANELIGKKTFIGWPFLQEGMIFAVSDCLFKYEKMEVVPGSPSKVIGNPHTQHGLGMWKGKAERIESIYSKKAGVITGNIDALLHVRPLKGLKRLESGALVKEYEAANKETEQAVQMSVPEVISEDPRYVEREPPPLSQEFPVGSRVFFLGEHAYGVAAQVSATTKDSLSVILAFFPSDKSDNDAFKTAVADRAQLRYYPSFKVADMLGMSSRALSRVTSSFMVLTQDGAKVNLGLSLKFEAKSMKVLDYSRKDSRHWEFSDKAIDLIREYQAKYPDVFRSLDGNGDEMARASDIFPQSDSPSAKAKEVRQWLTTKGVRDFEPVSLYCDQLKKDTVLEIEKIADQANANRIPTAIKKAIVKNIPRRAVLKPAHAVYRLQNQRFDLGDRVTMVQDTGGVPLSAKGVVIGLNNKNMDVVWDVAFMSGTSLGDRCSQYRGSTVEFNTCLNLSNPQFVMSVNPKAPPPPPNPTFKPRIGPQPAIQLQAGHQAASGFRAAPQRPGQAPVHIMTNPNRGRGGSANGRGGSANGHANAAASTIESPAGPTVVPTSPGATHGGFTPRGGFQNHLPPRGGFAPGFRGRGRFAPGFGGRGGPPPRGGFRGGRGRGYAPPLQS
ncbi:hypothetical protein K488DRAFT_89959 [Vararia minispora EC-137]|uniref:Uncharacterized protein n=1 Tax=Vararia minispora EC-137 TaxID=1314806 RepID=A0ACB8Q9K4_9AGAM|nr:hypothetical protein K488DRAFT_89959 [Vararia minispora EC-137]